MAGQPIRLTAAKGVQTEPFLQTGAFESDPVVMRASTVASEAIFNLAGWGPGAGAGGAIPRSRRPELCRRFIVGAGQERQDLADGAFPAAGLGERQVGLDLVAVAAAVFLLDHVAGCGQVGRASCRERV